MQFGSRNNAASAAFGQRGDIGSRASHRPARPAKKHIVRYTWSTNWMALALLIGALIELRGMLFPSAGAKGGLTMIPLTSFDPQMMTVALFGIVAIALAWLWQGISRGAALTMTHREVSGFTLLGRKTIRWSDVDRLQLSEHETYGTELIIHAKRGTPSSSIWLNCIPVAIKNVDHSQDELVAAIKVYRPDLVPMTTAGHLFQKFTDYWS